MLSLLVKIRALGPAIRIRAHIGDTLWDRASRPPLFRLPHRILPRIARTNMWDAEQSRQREQIEKNDTGAPVACAKSHIAILSVELDFCSSSNMGLSSQRRYHDVPALLQLSEDGSGQRDRRPRRFCRPRQRL